MSEQLLLVGGGGHCRAVIDVLEQAHISIAGIVHGQECAMEAMLGYPALGRDAELTALRTQFSHALVTVGQIKSPRIRQKLFASLRALHFDLPTIISPQAHVSPHAQLGQGTVIMHKAIVNACTQIGQNCIINTGAIIEHDAVIADHCHIAVGAIICGGAHIAEGTFVGAGSVVRENVRIAENCVIGCGSCITQDISTTCTVRGNHA